VIVVKPVVTDCLLTGTKLVSEELLGGGANFLAADFFGMQRIDRNKQQDRTY
jgi:hypothetical protein